MNAQFKTALVTGASGGIGAAICRALVAAGFQVVACARNSAKLAALADDLGAKLHLVVLDITDQSAVANLSAELPPSFAAIDVLINNAGHDTGGRQRFDVGSAEQWCDIVETNVQGMIRITHAVVDGMRQRGYGHIINMGSIAGLKPYATGSAYVTSKYAVHGFSETLRLDYAASGIRITEIMPGLVRSGFAEQRLGNADAANDFYDNSESCLTAEDVATSIVYALAQPAHVEIAQLVMLPVSAKPQQSS